MSSLSETEPVIEMPATVQDILDQFQSVFVEHAELPPRRVCDHKIPFIPGATPTHARPYRYALAMKDEIEKQVKEMLQARVIQPSTSAFSSPMLLVKKKEGAWRFCIDYRALNAMTVKRKFPIPMIDELLDELAGSRWFSKLDLRVGYHQICLAPGEEYETTFQTDSGQYKFRVMAFGLSGAPNTFQSAMNSTLSPPPPLRKCVLILFMTF